MTNVRDAAAFLGETARPDGSGVFRKSRLRRYSSSAMPPAMGSPGDPSAASRPSDPQSEQRCRRLRGQFGIAARDFEQHWILFPDPDAAQLPHNRRELAVVGLELAHTL